MAVSSSSPAYVLSIDSVMGGCSAGVYAVAERRCCARVSDKPHGQAEVLVPLVQDAMEEAGIGFADLDMIVTTKGPGSFTGLRTGLSAARSFALALDVPLVGLTTFEVLCAQFLAQKPEPLADGGKIAVLVESRRDEFFVQFFDAEGQACLEPEVLDGEALAARMQTGSAVFIGDAVERFSREHFSDPGVGHWLASSVKMPDPKTMALLALACYQGGDQPLPVVEPIYLREADVSVSRQKQRRLAQ